jgi:hypothetical protein
MPMIYPSIGKKARLTNHDLGVIYGERSGEVALFDRLKETANDFHILS